MLIFSPQTLSDIFVKKYARNNLNKKNFIHTTSQGNISLNKNIEYCNLITLHQCEDFVFENNINLVVVISHVLTHSDFVNFFKYNLGIPTVGVTKYWAKLEGSKLFAKQFMEKHNIPTADYIKISNLRDLESAISKFDLPLVIKDDGLCAGFGSYICNTRNDCIKIVKKLLKKNNFCLAEKYISGQEVTLHLIWDGNSLIPLEPVRDYKLSNDGENGVNTGSMGAYMPVKILENKRKLIDKFVENLRNVFQGIKPDFKGIFVCGLMLTDNECYNLEFNMRPGIPEFDVLVAHLKTDIFDIFTNIANGTCSKLKIEYKDGVTGCVNVVHKDYLKQKRKKIKINLKKEELLYKEKDLYINTFIGKFDKKENAIIDSSAPVLSIVKHDSNNPFEYIYNYLNTIPCKNLYYRHDIGSVL